MKRILLLGSTGSIGVNTSQIIRTFPEEMEIVGLSVNTNIDLLEKQIDEFKPKAVVVRNPVKALELKNKIGSKCEVLSGEEGLIEIASRDNYDILVTALVGFVGLAPTIEAIKLNKRIALANKETLVTAGEIVINLCKEHRAELIPID